MVFIGATLVMLFSNYFSSDSGEVINLPGATDITKDDLPIYTELGKDVLEDPRLDDLDVHGDFPITEGQVGRSNPFVIAETD